MCIRDRPLAVKGSGGEVADWVQLSRKHSIEANVNNRHISIFGGKLTDCLNVGDEVAQEVENFGITLPHFDKKWYGEPHRAIKQEYDHQVRLMNLDQLTSPSASEPLSVRLWRRYGAQAIGLLENIREDLSRAELLIENSEYIRCEVEQAARREMITKLDDFLRRRSKISMVLPREKIIHSEGLKEACNILFGEEAEAKLQEYIDATDPRKKKKAVKKSISE